MQNIKLKIENQFAFIEFDQPDSKVNVLSTPLMAEFKEIVLRLSERKDLKGAIILSAKPDIFIAGADIKEIENITAASDGCAKAEAGQAILNSLENLPFPTLALINGACLGGGLELALACDWRLAILSEKVKIGLPEVKLGVIPGFGGTYRLPRLAGLRKGLELILSGEAVSAENAFKIGLVDGLVSQSRMSSEGIEFLKNKKKRKIFKPKLKGFLNKFFDKTPLGRAILKNESKKFVLKTTHGQYPAVLAALAAVTQNYTASFKAALAREAQIFGKLCVGEVSKNLISVFYLVEKYKKARWVEAQPRKINKCAVLGAGVMGGGIAQLFSFFRLPVRMKDLNYSALGRGLKQAREVFSYAFKKRKIKESQLNLGMALISPTCDYSGFNSADLIVEAVLEDMQIKKKVFGELDGIAKPDAILASNTSCLSIAQMGEGVKNKTRLIGMHFFNPVHRMPLIELIRTQETSEETIATMVEFSKRLGKTPIVVKDSCGFLINRILLPYLIEAVFILEEGASFERIDKICLAFGLPMGPFSLVDEIGLDVGYKVALLLEESFGPRMAVPEILKKVYEKKWFGKKTQKGFYAYKGKNKIANKEIYNFIAKRDCRYHSDEEILQRMLYRMINEAAACLEEKVCDEPSCVDIGMIMGTGFPPFRGGLLRYADSVGCENILEKLEKFKKEVNAKRFSPSDYLISLAKDNKKFYML